MQITALGDLYQSQTERAQALMKKEGLDAPSAVFSGPDACERLCASGDVDAVLIATPVYFHPEHFEIAVDATTTATA